MRKTVGSLGLIVVAVCLASPASLARELTFEERVAAQEAIERVYYSHQIGATRPFEEAVPRAVLEEKVRSYLEQSVALERLWHTPVTAEMLQREMERQAQRTRMPVRLRAIHAALGNDVFLIQECLARPTLVDRLTRNFYAFDGVIHKEERQAAERLRADLESGELDPATEHPRRSLVEFVRSSPAGGEPDAAATSRRVLKTNEFDALRARLDDVHGGTGPIEDEREAYRIRVLLDEAPDTLVVATYVVAKRAWDDWWLATRGEFDGSRAAAVAGETVVTPQPVAREDAVGLGGRIARAVGGDAGEEMTEPCAANDTWDNGILDDMPDRRAGHTAVWTGSLMVVWGGSGDSTGGRYDPATDTWTPTSTVDAPSWRVGQTAVWTGSVMVVWGGYYYHDGSYLDTGGRYDPTTDRWAPTSRVGAPEGRRSHSAVWTGSVMVVWGGYSCVEWQLVHLNSGGRYDPLTDAWAPTSTVGTPTGREGHTAVWTGNLMVVWGGLSFDEGVVYHNNGGRYDPVTDTWAPISVIGAPSGRWQHSAVWTGHLMVAWGGRGREHGEDQDYDTGGRYDPVTDTWTATSMTGAPSARERHRAIWTGDAMVVWGGVNFDGSHHSHLDTGARYDPGTDSWTTTSTAGAPTGRYDPTAVWTGSLMVVWGGNESGGAADTGGRYDPRADAWTPTAVGAAPTERYDHTAVWTGSLMVIWGGEDLESLDTGGRYDPVTDSWTATSPVGAPSGRSSHTAIWTGNLMVVWGGFSRVAWDSVLHNTGGRYDPLTDSWTPTSTVGAPSARNGHTAVWTGNLMVVWGGRDSGGPHNVDNGGRYDPGTDTWTPVSTVDAPSGRAIHTAVWTGRSMIVWGGLGSVDEHGIFHYLDTGGRYDPATDTWTATSIVGAPSARLGHTAIWTGSEMVVWGGWATNIYFDTGSRYDPATDTWAATSIVGAPTARAEHTAIWTGNVMVVWGGTGESNDPRTGGRYDPGTDKWTAMSTVGAPFARSSHTAIWTGNLMVIWGGCGSNICFGLNDGGRYVLEAGAPPVANAGSDRTLECAAGGRTVAALDGSGSTDCDSSPGTNDDIVRFDWSEGGAPLASGMIVSVPFELGTHEVTLTVTDRAGATASDTMTITVLDTIPPAITAVASPNMLWPPDHQMSTVNATVIATDACDPTPSVVLLSVASSEPDDAPGDGDGRTRDDIQDASVGTADFQVLLRAERDGNGPGRSYTIVYQAADHSGNSSTASVQVAVPHDMGRGIAPRRRLVTD